MRSGDFQLCRVSTADELAAAQDIRRRVFVEEQQIPAELEYDGADPDSIHVLATRQGEAVATARLTPAADGTAVMARVAVRVDCRGSGLGRRVVETLEAYGRDAGITRIELHPHAYLEAFYADLGYRRVPGGEHTVGTHQLITMAKTLAAGD